MAVSERKLAANRANAKRSTGPRTAAGKAKVARNALAHGLTARAPLLPADDVGAYRRFARRMLDELRPDGALQEELAADIINCSWKLRRVPEAEARLLDHHHGAVDRVADQLDNAFRHADLPFLRKDGLDDDGEVDFDKADLRLKPPMVLFKMVRARALWDGTPNSPAWALDRYAARLERSRASALRMLLTLQKRQAAAAEGEDVHDDEGPSGDEGEDGGGGGGAPVQNKATDAPAPAAPQTAVSAMHANDDASPAAGEGGGCKATAAGRVAEGPPIREASAAPAWTPPRPQPPPPDPRPPSGSGTSPSASATSPPWTRSRWTSGPASSSPCSAPAGAARPLCSG